uniref:THAP domain-containing protein 9 n=1 Tax=Schizaphis graminum TaxID=13262 RepID=A0A2S2PS39_SCHGA
MVVDGNPGFTKESFEAIANEAKNRPIYCNLVIDEMCIRRYVEMDSQKKIYGYINMGAEYSYENDDIPLAKNALVFLVVGINGYWKMPIAYFLIDGLNGGERANLLTKAIDLLYDTGIHLCSVTFDGASVNSKMCIELGANFNVDNGKPYIINNHEQKLYIYYDPAHMLKLIRNAWEFKSVIINSKGEKICWKYIKMLYGIEQQEGLRAGTKLTKRHIEFHNEKMNVRLAAQTLSDSVADALSYLKNQNDLFGDVEPTVEFIRYINNAFDILNSRSNFSKNPYNKAISSDTIEQYTRFMQDFIPFIKSLEFPGGIKVINSGRKTGFVGFILSLQNAISMFHDLLAKADLYFFPTYKISQDHIETTFSAIRSRLGYNNNPTCREFKAAYKRIIIHNEVVGSVFGNCSMQKDI